MRSKANMVQVREKVIEFVHLRAGVEGGISPLCTYAK